MWTLQCKKKIENLFFCPRKYETTTPKSSILKQKFRRFRNFSLTAQQPKWQNSCSKMWSIEQLYIELGCELGNVTSSLKADCLQWSEMDGH